MGRVGCHALGSHHAQRARGAEHSSAEAFSGSRGRTAPAVVARRRRRVGPRPPPSTRSHARTHALPVHSRTRRTVRHGTRRARPGAPRLAGRPGPGGEGRPRLERWTPLAPRGRRRGRCHDSVGLVRLRCVALPLLSSGLDEVGARMTASGPCGGPRSPPSLHSGQQCTPSMGSGTDSHTARR